MDAAILSWQDCLFSQRVEQLLTEFLGNLELNGQKIEIKLQSYDLKQIEHHAIAAEVHRSKVQIVIISNHFIDRLRHEAQVRKKMSPINRVLRPKRVIAVLVQLTTEDVEEYHQSVLSRFHEWHVVEMKAVSKPQLDREFCGKVSEQIMKIYNAELSSTSNFIIFPNKATKDQPKIAILFKKPVEPGENVRFELSRGSQVQVLNDIQTTNPCSALIRVPDILCTDRSGLIELTPYVNNQKMGTKLVKYEYQAKRIDEDLIERMSQTLPGFQKLLDDHISQTLSKNFRLCEDFSLDPSLELLNDTLISREDDFPTVMHMACYYGLESTVWILLEEGDGLEQCAVRNDMNETPLDIAQAKGYEATIGQMITDYKEVNFTWKALQYVKDLYERNSEELRLLENGERPQNGINNDSDSVDEGGDGDEEHADDEHDETAVDPDQIRPSENEENGEHANDTEEFSESPASHDESCDEVFANVGHFTYSSNLTIRGNRLTIHQDQIQHGEMLNGEYLMMGPAQPPLQEKMQMSPANYYDIVPTGDAKRFDPSAPKVESPTNNVLVRKLSKLTIDPGQYIVVQPSAKPEISAVNDSNSKPSPNYPAVVKHPAFGITKLNSASELPSAAAASTQPPILLDASDENLIELMNNFKDNVYSMHQLQLLFENWKSRSDVQEDMKERQKELKRIRDEYKKIQEGAKKKKSVASLKLFSGKKKSSNAGLTTHMHTTHEGHINSKEVGGSALPNPSAGVLFVETHIPKPAPVSESDATSPTLIWKNPHDERFVTSYVQPTASASNQSQPEPSAAVTPTNTIDVLSEPESPPPPRPAKKISTTMVPAPMCLTPSAVPYVKKAPPPPPPLSPSPTPKLSFVNYTRFGKKK